MIGRKTSLKIRKIHRYLGLFLGIQFVMWTTSGLYFSWTDIDEIHGDQFLKEDITPVTFNDLVNPTEVQSELRLGSLELKEIAGNPYYWINDSFLMDARTGIIKNGISKEEALQVANKNIVPELEIKSIAKLTETDKHHEYRGRPLPAYVITYESDENLKAYISISDGSFQRVRHRSWRWFDFLWMTHTMDYEGRDNFNTIVLRAFSFLGLITVLSGFLLWYSSSPTIRKSIKKKRKKN